MVGICFYFEPNDRDVWSGRALDLDAWNYAAKVAGDVDRMVCVNRIGFPIGTPDTGIDWQEVTDPPVLTGTVARVVCPWDTTETPAQSLWAFDHAVDWYAFGPAAGWTLPVPGLTITIPQAGLGALHSVHVASVVLAHRYGVLNGG